MSAPNIVGAPLPQRARGYWKARIQSARGGVESFLERERGQLPLWLVACFGAGIACWFVLDDAKAWAGVIVLGFGVPRLAAFLLTEAGSSDRSAGPAWRLRWDAA